MAKPQIAVIVGSNRKESINRKLALALIKLSAGKLDATLARIDDFPLFNQDNENSPPPEVVRFKDEITRADGIIIVTPEHNRGIPAVLKNAIDWGARPYGKSVWLDKAIFVTGTSGGTLGSSLAQLNLRQVLGTSLGAHIMGGEAYISFKPNLIDDQGTIAAESVQKFLQGFVDRFATFVEKLTGKA